MCANRSNDVDPIDKLIEIEWDMINRLRELLKKAKHARDKVRISNSLAYHANTLNKLLMQKGESPLDDENLGALLTKIPKKWRLAVLRDHEQWRRKSLSIV